MTRFQKDKRSSREEMHTQVGFLAVASTITLSLVVIEEADYHF